MQFDGVQKNFLIGLSKTQNRKTKFKKGGKEK
jgi:hypothetical protein